MSGKRLLIIGYGRIGRHLARMAEAFGMTIAGYDPYLAAQGWPAGTVTCAPDLMTGLAEADFISVQRRCRRAMASESVPQMRIWKSSSTWVAAQVVVMLVDGMFQAQIVLPDGTDEWLDWFTWEEEGSDWRRAETN